MYFTQKQLRILNFIRSFTGKHGHSPTLEEIGQEFEIQKVTVFRHIQALERKGVLRKTPNAHRSLEIVDTPRLENVHTVLWVRGDLSQSGLHKFDPPRRVASDLVPRIPERHHVYQVADSSLENSHLAEGDFIILDPNADLESAHWLGWAGDAGWRIAEGDSLENPLGAVAAVVRVFPRS